MYDILVEKWIPAFDENDQFNKYGLIDVILNAHHLKEISSPNPMIEFSIYRFLNVFTMDMLRPEMEEDVEGLIEDGFFSKQSLDQYIDSCKKDGTSFDLFDADRPFMQVKMTDPDCLKDVNYLDMTAVKGNNPVHFDHRGEGSVSMSFDEVLPNILTYYVFSGQGGRGYPKGINDDPPYYAVIKGKNLFETLCFMMIPIEDINNFDEIPVFWRNASKIEPQTNTVSWLYGMLFPARLICAIPDWEEKVIKQVYFTGGSKYTGNSWIDPNVTYITTKTGRAGWKPEKGKDTWENIYALIDLNKKTAPQVLEMYRRYTDNQYANIALYGIQVDKASLLQFMTKDIKLPMKIAEDGEKVQCIEECIVIVQKIREEISKIYQLKRPLKKHDKLSDVLLPLFQKEFVSLNQECETRLWIFIDQELTGEQFDFDAAVEQWTLIVLTMVRKMMNAICSKAQLKAEDMMQFYEKQSILDTHIFKLMGGSNNEEK